MTTATPYGAVSLLGGVIMAFFFIAINLQVKAVFWFPDGRWRHFTSYPSWGHRLGEPYPCIDYCWRTPVSARSIRFLGFGEAFSFLAPFLYWWHPASSFVSVRWSQSCYVVGAAAAVAVMARDMSASGVSEIESRRWLMPDGDDHSVRRHGVPGGVAAAGVVQAGPALKPI
uniref:Uncharacterized protein n=1 Tax=Oryza rufipogon TaxID=4529 RepID=A0A0E0NYB0_ORYRU